MKTRKLRPFCSPPVPLQSPLDVSLPSQDPPSGLPELRGALHEAHSTSRFKKHYQRQPTRLPAETNGWPTPSSTHLVITVDDRGFPLRLPRTPKAERKNLLQTYTTPEARVDSAFFAQCTKRCSQLLYVLRRSFRAGSHTQEVLLLLLVLV